ncbi:MAG TPA: acyl-CoA dehydrogenase [Ilumatobacter sp.]|nr:acyl-CoA dehydrogenase [Ilumatobacter sp.]
MYFGFTDEQRELAEVVGSVLDAECSPDVVRAAWTDEPGKLDRRLWDRLVELGVAHVVVTESEGGLGLDERSLVLVLERAGYAGVPLPIVESALVGPGLLGADVAGRLVATDLGGELVAYAADADALLLTDGPRLALHDAASADVQPARAVDGARRLGEVVLAPYATAVAAVDDPDAIALAYDRLVFGQAALLVGLAQRMLDLTVGYVTEREQFGVPVGSFQAVKHHCADALMELAFARPAVYRAAWSLATHSPQRSRDVSMAKAMAGDAAVTVARVALQCHGAIAYTVEYDLHLFLKRAHALAAADGNSAAHRTRVARLLGLAA